MSTVGNGISSNGGGALDRISALHDNLKEKILNRLPLTDAFETSLLSRNWRRIWTRVECLKFDESFVQSIEDLTEARLTRIIERILLLHDSSLKRFSVYIPPNFDLKSLHLNGWFISLSRKGVQEFKIVDGGSVVGSYLSLPSNLFDCGRFTYLSLDYCALRLPANFQGLNNLVKLDLCYCHTTSKGLAELISRCPNIRTLYLCGTLEGYSEPLIINAPNVRIFHFVDYISGMIILKNTSSLTVVSLRSFDDLQVLHKQAYTTLELLCSLVAVEELTFDLPLLEPFKGDCPKNLEKEFVAMKTLTLDQVNICSQDDVAFIFCLFRSSPNLKTLNISMQYIDYNDEVDEVSVQYLEAERRKGYNFSQLLNVKITEVTGLRCETMLVNTMLSSCPLLKTLHIELSSDINIEKEARMAWELFRCRRLSRDVELMCSKSEDQL